MYYNNCGKVSDAILILGHSRLRALNMVWDGAMYVA